MRHQRPILWSGQHHPKDMSPTDTDGRISATKLVHGSVQDRFAANLAIHLLGQDATSLYIENEAPTEPKASTVVIIEEESTPAWPTLSSPPPPPQYWRSNITLNDRSALALLYHEMDVAEIGNNPKLLFIDVTFTCLGTSLQPDSDNDAGMNIPESTSPTMIRQHRRVDCTLGFFFLMQSSTTVVADGDDVGTTTYGQYIPCKLMDWENLSSDESSQQSGSNMNCDQSTSDLADSMAHALFHLGMEETSSEKDDVAFSLVATLAGGKDDPVVDVVIHRNQSNDNLHGDDNCNILLRDSTRIWKLTFRMGPSTGDGTLCSGVTLFGKQQLRFLYWDLIRNCHVKTSGTSNNTTERKKLDETVRENPVDAIASLGCTTSSTTTSSSASRSAANDKQALPTGTKEPSTITGSTGSNTAGRTSANFIKTNGKRARGMAPLPSGRRKRNSGRLFYGSADNAPQDDFPS